jgi:subtilase family serine protease
MTSHTTLARMPFTALALSTLFLLSTQAGKSLPLHNVPKAVEVAHDLGSVDAAKEINLTVVLQLHNSAAYDKAVEALYDPASPTYHHWFTDQDFAKYAPTAAEFDAVKEELINQGFSVVSSDPHRFSIRVHGTVAKAESAFQTQIHSFSHNGRLFDAHTSDAQLRGSAGALVESVAGLERHGTHPQFTVSKNPRTNKPLHNKLLTKAEINGGLLSEITGTPLTAPALFTYSTSGSLPLGVYYGTVYDKNPNLTVSYTPAQLQAHYGLTSLIKQGYDGTGQTIALVEAYGYAAAEADANTAAQIFGLPALNSSNFSVIYPEGPPLNSSAADLTGWTTEIALDIQSAHSIAPGAKIVVVASAGQDNEDQIASLQYIIDKKLAYTVSSSWENDDEIISGPAEENAFNAVLKKGAAAGISFQFSTGDSGDLGLGTPVGAVGVPSNSPYATAVGGTSILNNPSGTGQIVAGWGNNLVYVASGGPTDPPTDDSFFYAGAGGGESAYYAKPAWQKSLSGTGRQVPDVSAVADPFTGVVVIYTSNGKQYAEAGVGGTSLASPVFSAIWAIADQYNGKPIGFAAPAVAKLKAEQITDVLPTSSLVASDPAGTVYDSSGATFYSANDLVTGLLYSQTKFPSAIWPFDSEDALVLSFGTDSSLTVTPGWDNVTGFGEPNGLPFIQGVTGKTTGAAIK